MDDNPLDGVESSPKRTEVVLLVLGGGASIALAAMLGAELARRNREKVDHGRVAVVVDLAAPIPEVIISHTEHEPIETIGDPLPKSWIDDMAMLEARVAKPVTASWKEDTLARQVSPYGPQVRTVSALRKSAKRGRK